MILCILFVSTASPTRFSKDIKQSGRVASICTHNIAACLADVQVQGPLLRFMKRSAQHAKSWHFVAIWTTYWAVVSLLDRSLNSVSFHTWATPTSHVYHSRLTIWSNQLWDTCKGMSIQCECDTRPTYSSHQRPSIARCQLEWKLPSNEN